MPEKDLRVALGVITGAHGIKGEVVLRSYTAEPEAIARYGPLTTADGETIEIARLRSKKGGFIAKFKGIGDRNGAEALTGKELFVARVALPPPKGDEIYLEDLVGLAAILPDGSRLGEIVRVLNFGAGDLLEIAVAGRKDTALVPFERFVTEADIANGRVTIDLPENYLDSE